MKLAGRLIVAMLACALLVGMGTAAAEAPTFEGLPVVRVVVDGEELKTDVPAVFLAGRTMVPLRAVSDALGADVRWDEGTREALIDPSGSHVLNVQDYTVVAEKTLAVLESGVMASSDDPEYRQKNEELAALKTPIIHALEQMIPPEGWETAHHAAILGLSYLKATIEVGTEAMEALEKAEKTKKLSDLNNAKRIGYVWEWLGEQVVAQHDILHAEFVRLTGREPDHQIFWQED